MRFPVLFCLLIGSPFSFSREIYGIKSFDAFVVCLGTQYCDDCVYLAKTYKTRPEDDPVVKIRPRDDRFIFSGEFEFYQRESTQEKRDCSMYAWLEYSWRALF